MKVAIVTGASSGIGASSARELARRGWRVAINYATHTSAAEKVAGECGDAIAAIRAKTLKRLNRLRPSVAFQLTES